jgi:hypothetical protein
MWVILLTKLPCEVSPPKLSIFWSTPWPHPAYAAGQATKNDDGEMELVPPDQRTVIPDDSPFGVEPNWNGARQILFDGKTVRIFPHEFNPVSPENMKTYIDEGVYSLVPEGVASEQVITDLMEGDRKVLWEHALVDGCTDAQARMVAMGVDVTLPDAEIPPVGWWRCKKEYAEMFCHEWEMAEHRMGDRSTNEAAPKDPIVDQRSHGRSEGKGRVRDRRVRKEAAGRLRRGGQG